MKGDLSPEPDVEGLPGTPPATGSEVRRIQDQLRRAVKGGAWHGASLDEILDRLTPQAASARPVPQAHSPWEIALHVVAWLEAVTRRLGGEEVELEGASDWPPAPDATAAAWAELRGRLERAHRALQDALEGMADAELARPVPGKEFDRHFMLHGLIQHTLYHAGQIAVLGKGGEKG